MSLIVTSSSKDPTNITSQGIGIQSPFSYQNTFRSPLIIKPNSEVAVQSVRCNRQGYHFTNDAYFCIYWGKELPESESITADHVTNQPIYVRIEAGSYTSEEFADEVQNELSATLKRAYPNIIGVDVDLNEDTGFTFTLTQLGTGASFTGNTPDDKWIPVVGPLTRDADGDELDATVVASGAVSANTQVITASEDNAHAINTGHPLSLCNGEFVVDFTNATSSSLTGWEIGLTRNLYDPKSGVGTYTLNPKGFIPQNNDDGMFELDGSFYDFVVVFKPGSDLKIYHYVANFEAQDEGNLNNVGSMVLVDPAKVITSASLLAGTYDKLKFEFTNENIKLAIQTTGGAYQTLVDSEVSTDDDKAFKPTGLTTQALYPKIFIKRKNDSVEVTDYSGIDDVGNVYDFYANKTFGLPLTSAAARVTFNCDSNQAFSLDDDGTFGPVYTRLGVNGSKGQAYSYVLLFAQDSTYNTILDGYLHRNLSKPLGFKTNTIPQSARADGASTANNIIMKSQEAPSQLGSGSLFIRVNNLPFNSLNGATESISQILYACPRFDANGNSVGGLYYEPAERTYLKLKNTEEYVLSDINVEITDINERVANDLEGNTIVCLHIREHEKH